METHAFENFGPDDRMDLHFLELFRRELARFGNDVLGHGQLADVVQQRRGFEGLQLRSNQPQIFADLGGVNLDAPQVIVGGVIFGVDGQRQGFNSMVRKCRSAISETCRFSAGRDTGRKNDRPER